MVPDVDVAIRSFAALDAGMRTFEALFDRAMREGGWCEWTLLVNGVVYEVRCEVGCEPATLRRLWRVEGDAEWRDGTPVFGRKVLTGEVCELLSFRSASGETIFGPMA